MKHLLLLLFCTIHLLLSAQVQQLTGRCVGKFTIGIEGVTIQVNFQDPSGTVTDSTYASDADGYYSFQAKSGTQLTLSYSYQDLSLQEQLIVSTKAKHSLPLQVFNVQVQRTVTVSKQGSEPFEIEKLPQLNLKGLVSLEKTLTLTTAATSNNELTSNYNVRGGNYDENLVYVNGFQVYRPFLTRSGQQEGMSFIHSSLVQDVRFSAGGFAAQYGDRLSSVLDITYKTPEAFHASAMASLLGVETHVEDVVGRRFNFLVGARYRSNGYFLNSLPTKGAYNPVFADAQLLTNYQLSDKWTWSLLGHFSSNSYNFAPQTAQSDFGTANEAYRLMIYFDGQERSSFQTMLGGTAFKYAHKKTSLDFYASAFTTNERENFDIQGQYYINELETDPSKESYGDSIATLGVGGFLNHARNHLNATILSVYHNGSVVLKNGFIDAEKLESRFSELKWGIQLQHDQFHDVLSEWKLIDSAGYSLPQGSAQTVELYETIKGQLQLTNFRVTAFVQWNASWLHFQRPTFGPLSLTSKRWNFSLGLRGGYTSVNQEPYLCPRAMLSYAPKSYMLQNGNYVRRNLLFKLSSGLYYQPPFYREFRTFTGQLNPAVLAQKSLHLVLGSEFLFQMWGRETPFKFSAEAYYKYLWNVNPYEIENVRTRYYANNNAIGYAYGLDLNVHGEFVPGIQSFFKLGLLSTKEDIKDDHYTVYYNAAGERIIFGYSQDQQVVDSAVIYPGFIPRPSDQLLTFGALVQDQMPGFEQFKVQMGLQFGSRLPYGPPDFTRYKDTLRMKSYFRVDLGLSYDLLYQRKLNNTNQAGKVLFFDQANLSLEIFNLLGVHNVLSKQWIQDVSGKYYAIPNYLTNRLVNLKLSLVF
ncbi:MAG: hypothetical protein RLZZ301_1610 [Bacteroidota bacterium]|jgi:hypothetical protein